MWLYLPEPWRDAGILPAITISNYAEAYAQGLSLHLRQLPRVEDYQLCIGITIDDNMVMCHLMTGMPLRTRALGDMSQCKCPTGEPAAPGVTVSKSTLG